MSPNSKQLHLESRGFVPIAIIIGVVILAGLIGGGWYVKEKMLIKQSPDVPEQKACTAEAMLCPDGSSVSRSGPNCEFAQCPNTKTGQTQTKPATSTNTVAPKQVNKSIVPVVKKYDVLTITEPKQGTFFKAGDKVTIKIVPPTGVTILRALFSPGMGIVEKAPFEFRFKLPEDAVGQIDIDISAFGNHNERLQASSYIIVPNPVDQLVEIYPSTTHIIMKGIGDTYSFYVVGHYTDGTTRTITNASTSYRPLSGTSKVFETIETGKVRATGYGEDILIVESGNVSVAVQVCVLTPEDTPNSFSCPNIYQ